MAALGVKAEISTRWPVHLVIDHSVMVDFSREGMRYKKITRELRTHVERFLVSRWGQSAFNNFRVGGRRAPASASGETLIPAQTVWTSR